jgi:hypothetical protein
MQARSRYHGISPSAQFAQRNCTHDHFQGEATMPNQWTIRSTRGGRDQLALAGCHIIQNDEGNYQFSRPFSGDILSTTTGNQLPTPPFDFPPFSWAPPGLGELTWWIHVSTLTGGPSGNQAQGTWRNNNPTPDPAQDESGTFTAQAGAMLEEESEGDAAAASAGGGKNV